MLVEITYRGSIRHLEVQRKIRKVKFFGRKSSYIETERDAIDRLYSFLSKNKAFTKTLSISDQNLIANSPAIKNPLSILVKIQVCKPIVSRTYGPFDCDF